MLVALGVAVVAVAPYAAWWSEFPNPMASHWGADGVPNGAMSPFATALILCGFPVVCGLVAAVLALGRGALLPTVAGPLAGLGCLLVPTIWMTAVANKGAATWQDAAHLPLAEALIVGLLGLPLGAAIALVMWRILSFNGAGPSVSGEGQR